MVRFDEEYGYQIYFPETLECKLVDLYLMDDKSYDEMNKYIKNLFPYVSYVHTDTVDTDAFMDWHEDKNYTKSKAHEADKEIQKAIRKWFKECKTKERKLMVKSEHIYSPQNYLELVTGKCYVVKGDNDIETIESILKENGYNLRNYPLSEIDSIVENNLGVVLVDCMVWNDEINEFEHSYRWFEV